MRATEFISEGFAGIPDYKTMPAYKLKKASKGKHKFFLPTDSPVPAGVSALDEYDFLPAYKFKFCKALITSQTHKRVLVHCLNLTTFL